uniref:FkbM family methyltransferase n=1 Tax=Pedobacter nutrimenti TaxID=1241337 RepID=UPI0029300243
RHSLKKIVNLVLLKYHKLEIKMAYSIKRKIKFLLLTIGGRNRHLKRGVKCNSKWYGNMYGGFYVCPTALNEDSVIYSFGIGEDISFDKDMIENHNCYVFGFDPTPKSINWLANQKLPERFKFHEFGISNKSGTVDFYLPKNQNHVSGSIIIQDNIDTQEKTSVIIKSLDHILRDLGHQHIDVLKMDIEGAEYDVIENILKSKISISQILIEFHDRFFENGKLKTQETIKKLNDEGYKIFAVSETYEEVSFIHKDSLKKT